MTDYEYIQRLKLLGNNDICDIHNIEKLKQYSVIEAVSRIKGINVDNAVRFVMAYELDGRNVGHFIKNMQIACKLFGSDIVTKMLSDWHEERVEHDVFVGEKDIYFRHFIDNFDECEWLRVDSEGNAQRITEKYKNVVKNRKAILITI